MACAEYWRRADSETELNERMVLYASQQAKSRTITSLYEDAKEIFEHDQVSSYTDDVSTLLELTNAKRAMKFFLNFSSSVVLSIWRFCLRCRSFSQRALAMNVA